MAGKDAIEILSQIETFDGYGDSNSLQFFFKNCDAMMKVVKETEKNKLASLIFGTKLKGKAQEITQYHEFNSWDEIKEFLSEHFTDKRPPSHFLNLLMNIRQNYRESIKDYGERVNSLFNKYKETCHLNYTAAEAKVLIDNIKSIIVNNFRKGLQNEKIQIKIIAENTNDLDRAITLGIEMEMEDTDKLKNNQRNVNFVQSRGNQNYNGGLHNNQNIFCMFCNKNNHFTSQCRLLQNYEQNSHTFARQNFNRNSQSNNFRRNNSEVNNFSGRFTNYSDPNYTGPRFNHSQNYQNFPNSQNSNSYNRPSNFNRFSNNQSFNHNNQNYSFRRNLHNQNLSNFQNQNTNGQQNQNFNNQQNQSLINPQNGNFNNPQNYNQNLTQPSQIQTVLTQSVKDLVNPSSSNNVTEQTSGNA